MDNHFSYEDVKAAVHALCSKSPLNAAKEKEVTLKVAAIIMNRCTLELCLNAAEHIDEDELKLFLNNTRLQLLENELKKKAEMCAAKKSAMKSAAMTKPLKRKVSSQVALSVFQSTNKSSPVPKSHRMVRRSSVKNTKPEHNEKEEGKGTTSDDLEARLEKKLRNRTQNSAEVAKKVVQHLVLCGEQQMDPLELFSVLIILKEEFNIGNPTNVPKKVKFV
ncbi:hypothetical protein Ddc_02497 [Ditylenchus destructor]|nr:hypothetical protein Ddc_02497 [Ditylenchus destructor]